ncbi:hypothetical protein GCM10022214_43580 [Actinomadura miaoliensis]|uniref:Uncharacterized protein n=1 Tax=Actinomadura miaoliensis TaxID=430685 RepID=A0ABP7W3P4_9ACTN
MALPAASCGKNTVPMIEVITPAVNTPKSNHSMQLPMADATTAFFTAAGSAPRPSSGAGGSPGPAGPAGPCDGGLLMDIDAITSGRYTSPARGGSTPPYPG